MDRIAQPNTVSVKTQEVLDLISFFNSLIEDTNRLAEFITSRQMGKSVAKSIRDAKEVTVNFNRKGSGEFGNNYAKAWTLFLNPAIQGMDNLVRRVKDNPKNGAKILSGVLVLGAMQPIIGMIMASLFGDDDKDKYMNLPEYIRRQNICLFFGGHKWITIPISQELRPVFAIGETLSMLFSGQSKKATFGTVSMDILDSVSQWMPIDAFSSINGMDIYDDNIVEQVALNLLVPDTFKPFSQAWTNRNYYGNPIYKDNLGDNVPLYRTAYNSTGQSWVEASRLLNQVSGGDYATRGWADLLNPAQAEYIVRQYSSGVYNLLSNTLTTGTQMVSKDKGVQVRNLPIIRRLITESSNGLYPGASYYRNRFYKIADEAEAVSSRLTAYRRIANGKDRDAHLSITEVSKQIKEITSSEDYKKRELVNKAKKRIQKINEQIRMTDDEDTLIRLRNEISEIQRAVVEQADGKK